MKAAAPHYLLFSESCRKDARGQWRFVLQPVEGGDQFEAADAEPEARGERLELLAVVRGLEALEQPSRVTLVTPSKYVQRGLTYGLAEWRARLAMGALRRDGAGEESRSLAAHRSGAAISRA